MTARRRPSEPPPRPHLRVSIEKATTELQNRIAIGRELVERLKPSMLPVLMPGGMTSLDPIEAASRKWDSVNVQILRWLFDTDEVADQYSFTPIGFGGPQSLTQRLNDMRLDIEGDITRLEAIVEKLPYYDRLDTTANPRPPEHSGNVSINVSGTVAQLVVGRVENIATHVKAVSGLSADEFATAIKAVTEAAAQDRSLSDDARASALEDLDYLAEEAGKTAIEQRPSLIRRVIGNLQLGLGTAIEAKAAWDAWGPTISNFLGH